MKHVTLLITSLFFLVEAGNAQVITSAWAPAPGITNQIVYDESTDGLAPGAAGSGQSWDFSGLSSDSTFIETFVQPSTASGASNFPDATTASSSSEGGIESSAFFQSSSASFAILGSYTSGLGITIVTDYSDPLDIVRFPVGFGQEFSDDYASSIDAGIVSFNRNGSVTVTVDGSGNLTTPAGTYSNVLRVKTIENYQFVGLPPIPPSSTSGVVTSYNYISSDYPGKILLSYIINDDLVNTPDTSVSYSNTSFVGIQTVETNALSVYPNPANNQVFVKSSAGLSRIEILDLQGRLIISEPAQQGNTTIAISTSSIDSGIYLLRGISSNGKTFVQRISVAH